MKKFIFIIFYCSFSFLFYSFAFASDHIIISQFQVSGVSATDEFIELYNPTNRTIDLFDYKIQKKSASGASYNLISSFPEKTIIKPFSYFLLSHQNFSLQSYIKPDLIYSNYSLANDNSIILYDSDSNIIDYVGFGGSGYCEGDCILNILSNQSYVRFKDYSNYGYGYGYGLSEILCSDFDLNNNKIDFFVLSKSSPRNSLFKNECKISSIQTDIVLNKTIDSSNGLENNSFNNIFAYDNVKGYFYDNNIDQIKDVSYNKNIDLSINKTNTVDEINKEVIYDSEYENKKPVTKNTPSGKDTVVLNIEDTQFSYGERVSFYGIVSSIPGQFSDKFFYLNGMQVYNSKSIFPKLSLGDKVLVYSVLVSSNYGEKRVKIDDLSNIKIVSKNNNVDLVDLSDQYEDITNLVAKLVYINGVVSRKSASKIYLLSNDIEVEVYLNSKIKDIYKQIKIGDELDVIGILNQRNDSYRILPRSVDDIKILDKSINDNSSISAASIINTEYIDEDKIDNSLNKEIEKTDSIVDNKNNSKIDSYSINNNNKSFNVVKYLLIGFLLFFSFIIFLLLKKMGFLLKLKMFFKLILAKIK